MIFQNFLAIYKKDVNLLFVRSGFFGVSVLVATGLFSIFRFALPVQNINQDAYISILWSVHMVCGTFILLASQEWEWEWMAYRAWNISGLPAPILFLGKSLAVCTGLFSLWILEYILWYILLRSTPIVTTHYIKAHLYISLAALLNCLGISFLGTIAAGIAIHGRFRHLLLILILFPLSLPIVITSSSFTRAIWTRSLPDNLSGLNMEWAFICVYLAAGIGLYEYLLEE